MEKNTLHKLITKKMKDKWFLIEKQPGNVSWLKTNNFDVYIRIIDYPEKIMIIESDNNSYEKGDVNIIYINIDRADTVLDENHDAVLIEDKSLINILDIEFAKCLLLNA